MSATFKSLNKYMENSLKFLLFSIYSKTFCLLLFAYSTERNKKLKEILGSYQVSSVSYLQK